MQKYKLFINSNGIAKPLHTKPLTEKGLKTLLKRFNGNDLQLCTDYDGFTVHTTFKDEKIIAFRADNGVKLIEYNISTKITTIYPNSTIHMENALLLMHIYITTHRIDWIA